MQIRKQGENHLVKTFHRMNLGTFVVLGPHLDFSEIIDNRIAEFTHHTPEIVS